MKVDNLKARYNYQLFESFEAGIALLGWEASAIRHKDVSLASSHVKAVGGELFLVGMIVSPLSATIDASRSRKLLLHKREIIALITKMKSKKLIIVPISVYTKGRRVKLRIALAKAKREFEKRETIKKRDLERTERID